VSGLAQRESIGLRRADFQRGWLDFAAHLVRKSVIAADLLTEPQVLGKASSATRLRELWELTDLSAGGFADEVAHFYALPRLSLEQLLAASSLAAKFSPRFLRDVTIFPCRTPAALGNQLVVADPTDTGSIRAAEMVFGGPVSLAVASFEDIATALAKRLDEDELPASDAGVSILSQSKY
jgi:general secretion pathway protein E